MSLEALSSTLKRPLINFDLIIKGVYDDFQELEDMLDEDAEQMETEYQMFIFLFWK